MDKYTIGPWSYDNGSIKARNYEVAKVIGIHKLPNGYLIAAAPDMAKALTDIWEMDPGEPYECINAMQKIALEALKKAHLTLDTEDRS